MLQFVDYLREYKRSFWAVHFIALAVLIFAYTVFFVINKENAILNAHLGAVWCVLFSLAIAYLRKYAVLGHEHTRAKSSLLVPIALRCILLAMLITAGLALTSLPIFWDELYSTEVLARKNTTLVHSLMKHLGSNFLINLALIICWISVYISTVSLSLAKSAEISRLKLEKGLASAQLENLNHQLNPHFLFNALNNVRFLIHENPEYADESLTILSELLRNALEVNKSTTISLQQEMEMVFKYFKIVKIQLEQRLDLDISIPDDVANIQVPPMCIQLLVENAIKHGVEKIGARSLLVIKAKLIERNLEIIVENPAPLADEASVNSTGTGLANLRERLSLLYGQASSLNAHANNGLFKVKMKIPADESHEMHYR